MAIKPGGLKKTSSKNPPFLSHEFVIQNHADIVSCIAMVFVVGLMLQATSSIASVFVALHHNLTGADPSHENPRGIPYTYETGWKDWCAVFFYTLICIIMHAVLQEYVIDKISKRLHLSKFKLQRFNDSFQLLVFYAMSFLWGLDVILRENYISEGHALFTDFPNHPMIFLHKLFFIIQLAYYLHILPELYFQKVKKEDQQAKILHAIIGFSFVGLAYFWGFQRIGIVLLTIHYFADFITHIFVMIDIFDRDEKFSNLSIMNKTSFCIARVSTMILAFTVLQYGVPTGDYKIRAIIALFAICAYQGHLVFQFTKEYLANKRVHNIEQSQSKKVKSTKVEKSKKERKRESDLPEADQDAGGAPPKKVETKKVK